MGPLWGEGGEPGPPEQISRLRYQVQNVQDDSEQLCSHPAFNYKSSCDPTRQSC